ncbi:Por secretion system C-terminal sorting domain-containing protein [Dyadobacter sp. SG02]|uniref:T9SS type A sorting domain-containing protein n=1 Tax=Dyadobacter sp. SG02 TaxID=1855291 RepID=UPI0008C8BCE4|nr:T9SS type A sorting domain-containing protein [Dyadobacter sp. SG02]SEI53260.1 Por secretion system C-terminal sorting domain-containing protein [Dyadobacter sp. SG02]
MKQLLSFLTAILVSFSANAGVAGEPVANDDVSNNNVPGSMVFVFILGNDAFSTGPIFPPLARVDIDASQSGNQNSLFLPTEGSWFYDLLGGGLTFTPVPGFTGDPTPLTYTLTENSTGLSDQATVTIHYLGKPTVTSDIVSVAPGAPITVAILSNDFLISGTTPAPTDVTVDIDPLFPGAQQTLLALAEGSWNYDAITGILTFSPLLGFTNTPTPITYTITDAANRLSDPGTVTINYVSKPTANDDVSNNNLAGSPVSVQILDNDLTGNGLPVVPIGAIVDIDAITPGDQSVLLALGQGFWFYNITGTLTFTPDPGFIGDPTPITYTLTENLTGQSDQATVTIDYLTKSVANNDVSSNNTPGAPVSIPILINDLLANGLIPLPGMVSVDIDPVTPGAQAGLLVPGQGMWSYDAVTGVLGFAPEPGLAGNPTPISYTLAVGTDISDPATVTVTYAGGPTATDDVSNNNTPGIPVSVMILANDLTSNGGPFLSLSATVDLDPSTPLPEIFFVAPGEGFWTYEMILGMLTFNPNPGFTQDPTPLTYKVTDLATNLSDQATVTIRYARALTANNDFSANNAAGSPAMILILANDLLASGSVPTPTDVSVDISPSVPDIQQLLAVPGQGTWSYDALTGILTFTPEAGFTSAPTPITYTLTDNASHVSAPATVTVTFVVKPVATDDISNLNLPGSLVGIAILANDQLSTGPVIPLAATVDLDSSIPGNQFILIVPGQGTWNFDGLAFLFFSPEIGFTGDPTPITYTLTENVTGESDQATITVQYLAPPSANAQNVTIDKPALDSTIPLDGLNGNPVPLSGTDPQDGSLGAGRTFILSNFSGLNGNTLLYNGSPVIASSLTILTYDPSALAVKFTGIGSTSVSFDYHVVDTQGLSSADVTYKLNWAPPLPVTLISFNATTEGSQVMLSWSTSEESNSDYFEVQRSGDGVNWQVLDQIPAAGLSSTIQKYAFKDEHTLRGQNLYRLKMVDADKSYAYSQIRSVQMSGGEKIVMSPNPVSDLLTVDLPAWKDVKSLIVVDQSGRKRASAQPSAKATFDVHQLEPGIYLVVINYINGAAYSHRILVK